MLSRNRWREGFASIPWESAPDYRIRDLDPPRLRRLIIDSLLCFTSDMQTYGRAVGLSETCPKNGDEPKSPLYQLAVRSALGRRENKLKICFALSCGRE